MKYDKDGINKNTKHILFDGKELSLKECGSEENLRILYTIDVYTRIIHKNIFIKTLMKLCDKRFNINIDSIKYNEITKSHEYLLPNGEIITFDMLSQHLENPPRDILKELESQARKGKCHSQSIELAISIEDSIVYTGTITVGNRKVLHSVCETKDRNGNEVLLDWTRNLVIDKNEYIRLFNFNILSSINPKDILNDYEFIKQLDFQLPPYLVFRDELMKDIQKNQFLFEQYKNYDGIKLK